MASVLVVEDDQFVRSALIRHLTDAAHTVRSVGTALEALREVAQRRVRRGRSWTSGCPTSTAPRR